MSTLAVVEISPMQSTMPVSTMVSHATRAWLSCSRIASSTASEIWSQILSGCPSVTDSDVNKVLAIKFFLSVSLGKVSKKRHPYRVSKIFCTNPSSLGYTAGIGTVSHQRLVAGLHRTCSSTTLDKV